ncbi:foldase protein PrsA [Evansella halocellulosilytica]|uniref:foldase protein PrsA n=1 Tax=Evansella halocellulosilytica TaxID=2011013 RepID=UPI0015CEAA1E|nr:peptidylprolyl isomerase [Evansella halocellulosilytica]
MKLKMTNMLVVVFAIALLVSACGGNDEESNKAVGETESGIEFPELDQSDLGDEVVAEFDGGEVTGDEFATFLAVQAFLNPEMPINDHDFRVDVIQELIMEKAIVSSYEENDEWVNEQTEAVWEQLATFYDEETMEQAYDTLNITEEDIKHSLTSVFKMESYFREQVTEEDSSAFYEEVADELTTADFTHILIATEEMTADGEVDEVRTDDEALELANDLYEQLVEGADIHELASEYSDDAGSVENGGRYTEAFIAELVPEFGEAILEQEIDEIGDPVRTDYGYHIIMVEDVQVIPFEEIEESLIAELAHEKYVEYYFETLPEIVGDIHL